MKDRVRATILRHHMLLQGDRVTVGLSGGADSVALLCILSGLAPSLGVAVSACHVNHGLRGEESRRDEEFCRRLCGRMNIALTVTSVAVREYCKAQKLSIEEGARILRYEALSAAAKGAKIATAHTLSDSAETVLFNLARGCALDGLCGIPPVRGRIIRPLIDITRDEVERYLAGLGQEYVTDSSNLCDTHARNRIRRRVVPVLRGINPAFERAIGRTTAALAADRDHLERQSAALLEEARHRRSGDQKSRSLRRGGRDGAAWSALSLAALDPALRLRALRLLLAAEGVSCDARRLQLADALLRRGRGALELSRDKTLRCRRGLLYVENTRKPAAAPCVSIDMGALPAVISIGEGKILKIYELSCQEIKFFVNYRPDEFKNALDCDRIEKIFDLRHRKNGDSIRLAGRGCTKTFKKLLNEAAIEPGHRDSLAVLSDGGGVLWLEGFGVCERAALTAATRRAILIETQGE
jgi:tRNA(Ile)-lysidine synthase